MQIEGSIGPLVNLYGGCHRWWAITPDSLTALSPAGDQQVPDGSARTLYQLDQKGIEDDD
ncbi:MAG: hypothetical protein ACKOBM_17255 [Gammaproteobacteria bacterium]